MAEAIITNDRGRAVIVEKTEDGIELTIEHSESGESEGIVLSRQAAQRVVDELVLAIRGGN